MSTVKRGIALRVELDNRLDEHMGPGSSRSQAVNECVQIALDANDKLIEKGWYHPNVNKRAQIVREALDQYEPEEGDALS